MELQLVETYVPNDKLEGFKARMEQFSIISTWHMRMSDQEHVFKLLIEKQHAESILNFLETEASADAKTEALLYNISTYVPHIDDEEKQEQSEAEQHDELTRASRQELYNVVNLSSQRSVNFRWMLYLSAIVATTGIVKDSAAVVIGAMVIAPLIGPFTAIAFSALLGDYKLMRRSLTTALYGVIVPLVIASLFGFLFDLPIESDEFVERTKVEVMDIILALAAGAAGALSFVKRVSEALVGVMASVALLPPTVVLGMMLGAGEWQLAITPLLLVLVNIHAIILSAIIVFWVTGIKPNKWQEIQQANTSRRIALFFVSGIIIMLGVIVFFITL